MQLINQTNFLSEIFFLKHFLEQCAMLAAGWCFRLKSGWRAFVRQSAVNVQSDSAYRPIISILTIICLKKKLKNNSDKKFVGFISCIRLHIDCRPPYIRPPTGYHHTVFWCGYITWISSTISKWNRLYLEYSTVNWTIDSIQFSTLWCSLFFLVCV